LEKCSQDLGTSTKAVSSAIAQLLSEATQGNENYTGMAARDVAQALKSLASGARGVAATTDDPQARNAMLDCAGDVMDKSANLIEETKRAIAKPGDAESMCARPGATMIFAERGKVAVLSTPHSHRTARPACCAQGRSFVRGHHDEDSKNKAMADGLVLLPVRQRKNGHGITFVARLFCAERQRKERTYEENASLYRL
ncbi:talin-1, partial [Lates japonicus]